MSKEKFNSFSTHFEIYNSLISLQYATVQVYPSTFNSHNNTRRLALELRANPKSTREEFKNKVFPRTSTNPGTVIDRERAINVTVQLTLIINYSDKDRHYQKYKISGFRPVK